MANRLGAETSPYLRQHAGNPVDWYAWGAEALAAAREQDRPILLSVGYSACHWCHVMAHECFENPAIAALMNQLFINIKVDREERPDVDAIYMQAVQALTGQGGWPMTMFLTPDGTPYFGGTYFPPSDRGGMRGFPTVLRAAHDAYRGRRDDVERAGAELKRVLALPRLRDSDEPDDSQLAAATDRLVAQADVRHGGFGGAPKFPHPGALELLLRRWQARGDLRAAEAAARTLDAMSRGGIHDQLGGGFHRYSVDARWAVPHFEKMLYDNAQLALVYLHGYQLTDRPSWRSVAEATLDYLAREMRLPDGGFASSQDADTEGEEGGFFIWTPAQVAEVLSDPEELSLARQVFGISDAGNFEAGATVLSLPFGLDHVARSMGTSALDLEKRMSRVREQLLAARAARVAPGRDDKVVTSWNALAVRAFAEAGRALGRSDYVEIARTGVDFLLRALVRDGVVLRTWRDGAATIPGFLEDVAYLGDALLAVHEATGVSLYYLQATRLAEDVVSRFRDPEIGYFDTAADAEPLVVRPRSYEDNPIPAGQSMAALLFLRLGALAGVERWRDHAREIIRPLTAAVAQAPLAISTLAAALDMLLASAREIAVVGDVDDPATMALLDVVWRRYDPNRVLSWGDPAGVPLMADRLTLGGRPTAYVCERFVCQAPVTDPTELRAQLESAASPARG